MTDKPDRPRRRRLDLTEEWHSRPVVKGHVCGDGSRRLVSEGDSNTQTRAISPDWGSHTRNTTTRADAVPQWCGVYRNPVAPRTCIHCGVLSVDSVYRRGWRAHTIEDTRVWRGGVGGRYVVRGMPIVRAEERRQRRPHWTRDTPTIVSASGCPLRLAVVLVGEWVGLSGHGG
jgi:hypothetical protein